MAENLNYKTESGSECYDSTDTDCKKYGRKYTWTTIMDTLSNGCSLSNICDTLVQGICPDGWRIPTRDDWETLFINTGAHKSYDNSRATYLYSDAAKKLMTTDNCFNDDELCGTDAYGFSVSTFFKFWTTYNNRKYRDIYTDVTTIHTESRAPFNYTRFSTLTEDLKSPMTAQLRCIKGNAPTPWPDLNDKASVKSSEESCKDSAWAPKVKPCNVDGKDNCEYGDVGGKKSVKIGEQEWVKTPVKIESWTENYCPFGWHTPDEEDWAELFESIGGKCFAGIMLKSKTGWNYRNGLNAYGLNIQSAQDVMIDRITFLQSSDAAYSDRTLRESTAQQYYCVKSHSAPDMSDSLFNTSFKYGKFTDPRDGQTYKTTVIGPQKWMSHNLNYETENSFCYQDHRYSDYCSTFGRYYTFDEAKTACPDGWHLPSKADFDTLVYFGGLDTKAEHLLSNYYGGKDEFGFSMSLSGYARNDSSFYGFFDRSAIGVNRSGSENYWSSDIKKDSVAYTLTSSKSESILKDTLYVGYSSIAYYLNVRCVNDTAVAYGYTGEYGTLTDDRDGQEYKTVEMNGVTWMAENLRYEAADSAKSYCYMDSCAKYGRYYRYPLVSDSTEALCPSGWHVPTLGDWDDLLDFVGDSAGIDLKAVYGWEYINSVGKTITKNHGMDKYGFGIVPNGCYTQADVFSYGRQNQQTLSIDQEACLAVHNPADTVMYYYYTGQGKPKAITKEISQYRRHFTAIRCVKD